MKQIKETWNLIFDWLGNGKKLVIGIGFLIIGFLWNYLSGSQEALQQLPYIIMLAGALCLVNALFSKLIKANINLLCFILIFVVIFELGMFLMRDEELAFTNMVAIWGACYLFVWALNYALLEAGSMDGAIKRIVVAFFETLVGALAVVATFGIPVWMAVTA